MDQKAKKVSDIKKIITFLQSLTKPLNFNLSQRQTNNNGVFCCYDIFIRRQHLNLLLRQCMSLFRS